MMAHLVISDPTDYEEAVKSKKWRMAMDDEIKSIEKNHTWKYASEVLQRFGMENYNPVSNPIVPGQKLSRDEGGESVDATQFKQMVGSLMYLTASRPDLMFVVSFISRFMANPTKLHFAAIKRVLRSKHQFRKSKPQDEKKRALWERKGKDMAPTQPLPIPKGKWNLPSRLD
ncbi:hypothetical protein GH714_031936 [Hevea brasiliensis]|uniref:Reverse transcriptase Ty1/copia-type domain-containing protein n=1 Tax=Hevea brasiliensis TaxID=3981 RepID=A0A6A6L1G0_HEVBR|nr:hypothetical protein GH714_031936 [Hevea brasiliensis]